MADGDPVIELSDVHKIYPDAQRERVVLRGINATFRRGEFVAIFGRSGSGKSTLLNLLGGIDLPSGGDIRFNGLSISNLDERRRTLFRREHVGFVFQFFNLIPTLTVFENLLFTLDLNRVDRGRAQRRVEELLSQLGLSDRGDSFPDRLSGGEQQRIAVARAVAHRPSLVLADEPTGNLDRDTEREVLALLRAMPQRDRTTVIAATHSPEVASCADRIVYLQNGTLGDTES
jgi:putative ABC transport system ATP-binding protein